MQQQIKAIESERTFTLSELQEAFNYAKEELAKETTLILNGGVVK